jgi:hypothetical protein
MSGTSGFDYNRSLRQLPTIRESAPLTEHKGVYREQSANREALLPVCHSHTTSITSLKHEYR